MLFGKLMICYSIFLIFDVFHVIVFRVVTINGNDDNFSVLSNLLFYRQIAVRESIKAELKIYFILFIQKSNKYLKTSYVCRIFRRKYASQLRPLEVLV